MFLFYKTIITHSDNELYILKDFLFICNQAVPLFIVSLWSFTLLLLLCFCIFHLCARSQAKHGQ